jgi:hypothetical protein
MAMPRRSVKNKPSMMRSAPIVPVAAAIEILPFSRIM